MSSKIRTFFLSFTVITVLIFSAVGPTTVYADDGAPTNPSPTDTTGGGSDPKADATDPQPTAEPVELDVKETPPPADPNTVEPTPENSTDPIVEGEEQPKPTESVPPVVEETAPPADKNILEQVPENTTVTVLSAEGQPQPLATQDAATAIEMTSDPIWCPATQMTPTPGANGCTASFTSFTALLTFLSGNAAFQGAGTIYVEQGAYAGGESSIDFNSYNLSNIDSFDLTVQGGWNTTTNTIDPASTSNFTVPILIGSSTNPWGGSLSINNLVITNASQNGLTLYSDNSISISNVQVTNSVNGAGADLHAGGNVSISNSKFLRNGTAGAIIRAGGTVAISDSDFSNTFNQRRQIIGLDIVSNDSVSLFNVLANGNRRVGARINALGGVTIGNSVFSETNALNSGIFYGYGLQVVSQSTISLDGVTANNNFLWGADLTAAGDITIANSIFNANSTESPTFIDDTGLLVTSGGNVTLDNVVANNNRLIGAVIDAVGTVSVRNSTFSNNSGITLDAGGIPTFHGYGLQVTSGGTINLDGVTASNNRLFGAHLESSGGDVNIANSFFDNQSSGSATDLTGRGLEAISTGGIVTLSNVSVSNNQLFGANIQAANNNIFLDLVTASNNGTDGVQVDASCTTLTGGTYSGNGQYGLNLGTSALNLSGSPVFSGNGAGDIFPATPTTCGPPVVIVTPPVNPPTGSIGNPQGSGLQQDVSYAPVAQQGGVAASVVGTSLNGLFGITREAISGGVVISIFSGNYVYVYTVYEDPFSSSIDNLQIIALNPAPLAAVAMVGP